MKHRRKKPIEELAEPLICCECKRRRPLCYSRRETILQGVLFEDEKEAMSRLETQLERIAEIIGRDLDKAETYLFKAMYHAGRADEEDARKALLQAMADEFAQKMERYISEGVWRIHI